MSSAGVYIVCAPHARVGVTTAARLLAEWCAFNGRPFEVFDTDAHFAPMQAWFPRQTVRADLGSVQGQIALFDSFLVQDGAWRIVDVSCRSYKLFFDLAAEIGFFAEAAERGVPVRVFFCADRSEESLAAAWEIAERHSDAGLFVVTNDGAAPLGDEPLDWLARYPTQDGFWVGAIDPALRGAVEGGAFALADFVSEPPPNLPLVVRVRLRDWVARVFAQFKAFDMRLALSGSAFLR